LLVAAAVTAGIGARLQSIFSPLRLIHDGVKVWLMGSTSQSAAMLVGLLRATMIGEPEGFRNGCHFCAPAQ